MTAPVPDPLPEITTEPTCSCMEVLPGWVLEYDPECPEHGQVAS